MVIHNKGRKPFAKAARAGKKINHSECRMQIKLLTNFRQLAYTGPDDEIQGGCDGFPSLCKSICTLSAGEANFLTR